jgi:hypothetical protein
MSRPKYKKFGLYVWPAYFIYILVMLYGQSFQRRFQIILRAIDINIQICR